MVLARTAKKQPTFGLPLEGSTALWCAGCTKATHADAVDVVTKNMCRARRSWVH
jgi:hypothetical protein